ncbi:MAG: alpha/beta fold hydrolase [Acidimicrobiia bacterium]
MPDARVEAAIAHWAPRFVTQGIDYNDFRSTTAGLERWEDWLDAWCLTGDRHAELAWTAEAGGHRLTAGEAWVRAALCYHFAKFVWMVDIERNQATTRRAIEALASAHRLLDPTAERVEIPWEGTYVIGNLRRPPGVTRPPLVLTIPGLDSTKEEFFNWEEVFLRRGLATFSLDGPGQGETGFDTSIRPDYETVVAVALDWLERRNDIDARRVGAVGVSLGGYYAARAIAFEPRLTAACVIGGPYDFGELWDLLPPNTRETFRHHSGAGDEEDARKRALELSLLGIAPKITSPLLVIFGKLDRLIPYQQAERLASEAPGSRLVMFEEGNHVCNNIPYKYRPLAADWLAEQLIGGTQ